MNGNLKLRVSAGPDTSQLIPISPNDDANPLLIDTPHLTLRLCVRIRDFNGTAPTLLNTSPYFDGNSDCYSIQAQLRWKREWVASEILFGNEFDTPLRLPPGAGIALKFARWFDPGFEADIYSERPWAFSPLLCSVNTLRIQNVSSKDDDSSDASNKRNSPKSVEGELELSPWPSPNGERITEDTSSLSARGSPRTPMDVSTRRKYFSDSEKAKKVVLGPDQEVQFDFFNAYVDFNSAAIRLPGFSVNVLGYWDGQPLRYVCKTRDGKIIFFVVQFELLSEEID
ncbi:uncharacterized protein VTP21DRAFT_7199 [Calcarisporiella thermophila]|uniref:uncharacterized protein n=1 Tax=Calcarisporiella thermophila TaxID=911321 RepID=UPI0037426DF5